MTNKNLQDHKNSLNKYVRFSGVAFQMIAIILLFSFLGVWLDGKFINENSIYTIICSLLGVALAIYIVIKQVIALNNNK